MINESEERQFPSKIKKKKIIKIKKMNYYFLSLIYLLIDVYIFADNISVNSEAADELRSV